MNIKSLLFATFILVLVALPINAQDTKSALKRGNALVAQKNFKAAIEEYGKVSPNNRDSYARAIYNIGVCHYELWQTEQAIHFYKRAIELKHGNYPMASYALGVALEDQGDLAEAKLAYQQASDASGRGFGPAIFKLGLLESKAGQLKKATELFRDAASRKGEHVAASHNNLGVMLARQGLLKEAEREFMIALKSSDGAFEDAAHNLRLCRSLMNSVSHKKAQKIQKEESSFVLYVPSRG